MATKPCIKCKEEIGSTPFCPLCGTKQSADAKKRNVKRRGNGQGTVYKRGDKWQAEINYMHDGHRRRKYKGGFKTKKEALDYIGSLRHDNCAPVKLSELYKSWSKTHYNNISDHRRKIYENAWERIGELQHRDIASVRYDELQELIDEHDSFYTKRDIKTVLRGIWTVGIKNGKIASNLAELLVLPSEPKANKKAFTEKEIQKMWDSLENIPFLCYPIIMIYTGMSPGELRNVVPENIDFEQNLIYGCGSKNDLRKSSPVLFPKKIVPLLKNFTPVSSKDKSWFYDEYKSALEQVGIDYLSPGCCRHTMATILAKKGTQSAVIQKIMRHSSYKTTIGYTHLNHDDEFKVLNNLE